MKTEIEKKFDELSMEYHKKFKKNYPLMITSSMTLEEVCEDIRKCLKENKQKKDYPYKKGADY